MHNKNKYKNGILPMILINFAIGSVYCWTLFRTPLHTAEYGFTPTVTAWAFSIALFMLGISAAFGGPLVERNPNRSAWLTALFFTSGWVLTGVAIAQRSPVLLLIGFGFVQGIGLGLGYITPVKTMMLWIPGRKGFAAALSITAFGLAGVIANPIIQLLIDNLHRLEYVFWVLAVMYGVAMVVGAILLYRPEDKNPDGVGIQTDTVNRWELVKDKKFFLLWFVFFVNIAAGLAVIGPEVQIYQHGGRLAPLFLLMTMTSATSNLISRPVAGWAQDFMKQKHTPYILMTLMAIVMCTIAVLFPAPLGISFALVIVLQFTLGVGFATNPEILHQNWGMKFLSTVQGMMLTAWAAAALVGPQITNFVLEYTELGLQGLFSIMLGMFILQMGVLLLWIKLTKADRAEVATAGHRSHHEPIAEGVVEREVTPVTVK